MTTKTDKERRGKESGAPSEDIATPGSSEPWGMQQHSWILQQLTHVTMEVGKLTANVEHLISDVKSLSDKVDTVRHQASYMKGIIACAVVLIGIFVWIATIYLSTKWDAAITAIREIAK